MTFEEEQPEEENPVVEKKPLPLQKSGLEDILERIAAAKK
jgi:hypothetical protein